MGPNGGAQGRGRFFDSANCEGHARRLAAMAAIGFLGRATSGPLTIREAGSSREEVPRRLVEQGFRAPMSTVGKRRPVRIDPGQSR